MLLSKYRSVICSLNGVGWLEYGGSASMTNRFESCVDKSLKRVLERFHICTHYSCRNLHSIAHNLPVYTKIHKLYVATHYFNGKLFSWICLSKQVSSLEVKIGETWQNDGKWRIILYLHNIHFNAIESFEVFVCTICCFCWRFCCGWWMEVMTILFWISMKATTLNEFQINQSGQHINCWPYYMQWSQ